MSTEQNNNEALAVEKRQQRAIDALGSVGRFTPEQVKVLKSTVAKGATDDELRYFLAVAQRTGLDPFTRQIHFTKRMDREAGEDRIVIITGIDGLRLVAQRSGEYAGQDEPQWCGPDGRWLEVWLGDMPPVAARVAVYRKGFAKPLAATARWKSYVQTRRDGVPNRMWKQFGPEMLAKCAEGLALRKAFPQELSGLYAREELDQASSELAPPPGKAPAFPVRRTVRDAEWEEREAEPEKSPWSAAAANEEAHNRRELLERRGRGEIPPARGGESALEQELRESIELAKARKREKERGTGEPQPSTDPGAAETVPPRYIAPVTEDPTAVPETALEAEDASHRDQPAPPMSPEAAAMLAHDPLRDYQQAKFERHMRREAEKLDAEMMSGSAQEPGVLRPPEAALGADSATRDADAEPDESLAQLDAAITDHGGHTEPAPPAWEEEAHAFMKLCGWPLGRHVEIARKLLKADHGWAEAKMDDHAWKLAYMALAKRYSTDGKKRLEVVK